MPLRVAEPRRLRIVAVGALVAGIAVVVSAGTNVLFVVLGALLLSTSLAAFDGLGEGQVGRRQLGLLLVGAGLTVGIWSAVVVLLLALLAIGEGVAAPTVLLALSVAAMAAGSRLVVAGAVGRGARSRRRQRPPARRGRRSPARRAPESTRSEFLTRSAS